MNEPANAAEKQPEGRQKALQEELRGLVDVVGPVPMVDLLLERAFQIHGTDIHLDPTDDGLRVRLRVDGMLHDVLNIPGELSAQVISRLKLMANMDITEKRLSQDGHISNAVLKEQRDIRVGSGPTIYGERLVLRLMPDSSTYTKLEDLGLEDEEIALVKSFITSPYGMVLSVGPVGCGKSTTLYSCLEFLNAAEKSLVTIEDPVERRMDGVSQIQIDTKIDFNFAEALRGVLRQDPNVMMVGEIRDAETAHIGVRAGIAGVTVLSTLHSNDTASAIDVFREFGIPPMFIGDSLQGILSQRLVRKVCSQCRTTYSPDNAERDYLGLPHDQDVQLAKGTGCANCFQTGYQGRTGIFEIMAVKGDLRDAILAGQSHGELTQLAVNNGMSTLEESAKRSVRAGLTTLEEVHRVLTAFSA